MKRRAQIPSKKWPKILEILGLPIVTPGLAPNNEESKVESIGNKKSNAENENSLEILLDTADSIWLSSANPTTRGFDLDRGNSKNIEQLISMGNVSNLTT